MNNLINKLFIAARAFKISLLASKTAATLKKMNERDERLKLATYVGGEVSLDLGSGPNPKNPFKAPTLYGIDIVEQDRPNIFHIDLNLEKLPFADCSLDYITAYDFLEHIPRMIYVPHARYPFIELMNEVSRVLKVGGIFYASTPLYPFAELFRDPTHQNFITEETFSLYFSGPNWAKMYGYKGNLYLDFQYIHEDFKLAIIMRKQDEL